MFINALEHRAPCFHANVREEITAFNVFQPTRNAHDAVFLNATFHADSHIIPVFVLCSVCPYQETVAVRTAATYLWG